MTTFSYVAVEPSGKKVSGTITAPDRNGAISSILAEGRFVLDLRESSAPTHPGAPRAITGRASRADLALFTRRLADLAAAGLPLDRAIQVVGEQSESPALMRVAEGALEDVRGGLPVSQALAKFPKFFSPIFTETLRAGEASGQFAEVAARLADFQEREVTRRSQIVSALIYPAVLTTVAAGVIVFLLTFVLPRLSVVFKDLGTDLPASTRLLLDFTDFLSANWMLIVGVVVGAFVFYRAAVLSEQGAIMRDRVLLRLPAAGKIVGKAVISRFSRVLSTLIYGGVPILESLRLSGMASGNRLIQSVADDVATQVRDGEALHHAMSSTGAFPPVLTHMVAIGEETGDLPTMLSRVADSLDFEVDTGVRRMTAMFEPLIVVVMGVFVGFVVLSVMLPIFEAQNLVK
ncbi:MAG: type II secretion system F family protein [Fimbriimonadaceae bacterium]|uniref:Type II secretion system protein F n=1 Tax=Candidatus Nitrosymbiomonas proteolyticus TaxID=2608984 RepID=A0A809RS38_9BACT|nr:MAG: type II secretion system protein F (GspF) [Armatimonadetes bacterium OLB18]MCK6632166.1 type II secretion system F family protein [Fimbriimonadaceae bacterium]NUM38989.1 type II secretion system F family protein [Armatimonadota bacterium]BBO22512.1 type II secretion system protein F [Candidatus Nitrosymbiomonas proteolyticus]RIK00989.1 MAG: hypothetical protein DCC46_02530 [Armatimonadota bacterium]